MTMQQIKPNQDILHLKTKSVIRYSHIRKDDTGYWILDNVIQTRKDSKKIRSGCSGQLKTE